MAPRILITTDYLHEGDAVDQLLRDHGLEPVYSHSRGPRTPAERRSLFDGISGAILASEPVTADMLAGAASLKVIARSGVGYDSIDIQAAAAQGIRVCNAPGTNHHSVAELTIGLIIMAARRLGEVTTAVRQGRWPRDAGHELRGSTLGIHSQGRSRLTRNRQQKANALMSRKTTAFQDTTPGIRMSRDCKKKSRESGRNCRS